MKDLKSLIAELRDLASKATPGPWKEDLGNGTVESAHADHYRAEVVGRSDIGERASWYRQAGLGETWVLPDCDIEFVAAANPETILRLCDELEQAKEAIECLYAVSLNPPDDASGREMFNRGRAFLEKFLTPK